MAQFRDQNYLLNSQYKDATNLNARIDLHRLFSVNKYGWHRWVFDRFQIGENGRVLELGCGPGSLWLSNRQRIPENWQITLSDFSSGMLQEARQKLGEARFAYQIVDAQAIPFADEGLDAVIANHMLYHVPDLPCALAEIKRVLKPGGHFYATTVGLAHMRELDDLIMKTWPGVRWGGLGNVTAAFVLENGQSLLAPFFKKVELQLYEDELRVTEAEPLIDYALSGTLRSRLSVEQQNVFREVVQQVLATQGAIRITKASGIFVATRDPDAGV